MNVDTLLRVEQVNLANEQLQQLQLLNQQLTQQLVEQQRQAVLSQVLFETDQMARRVRAAGRSDELAAAVHAESWLTGIKSVDAKQFSSFESKRSWAEAVDSLQAASARVRSQSSAASLLARYQNAVTKKRKLLTALAPDPTTALDDAVRVRARQDHRDKWTFRLGIPAAILGGLLVLLIIVLAALGEIDGWFFHLAFAANVAVFPLIFISDARKKARQASERLAFIERTIGELNTFRSDPDGAVLIAEVHQAHPMVEALPPAEAIDASGPHVIERQVVVARCQYCGTMTPVDLNGCQHCGARIR